MKWFMLNSLHDMNYLYVVIVGKSRNWPDTDYWEEPWEKEARRLQHKLAMNFSKEEWA